MQSKNFSRINDKRKLEHICKHCGKSRIYAAVLNIRLRNDPDWLNRKYDSNIVCEETFMMLIEQCSSIPDHQRILELITDVVNESCITDAVFDKLVSVSREIEDVGICIALSHKHLSESQLVKLCELQLCHECFYELVCRCYTDFDISCSAFVDSINRFFAGNFWEDYPYLFQELSEMEATSKDKKSILHQIISLVNRTASRGIVFTLQGENVTVT